jgi:2-succinyl-6-hydroxy-2,4-cyclohexadiene-1-carboxylate synthase
MTPAAENDAPMHCWGPREQPAVVFLHGFLGSGLDWAPVAEGLSDRYFCVAPDLPGHGGHRELPVGPGLAEVAGDLLSRLDALGVERCALGGYSMGARVALYLTAHYPDRVSALIFESGSPGMPDAAAREERRAQDHALACRLEAIGGDQAAFRAFLEEWHAQPLFASLGQDPARREKLIELRQQNNPPGLAAALRALSAGAQPDLWPSLEELDLPVLLIAGERDPRYRGIAAAMRERLPRASFYLASGCGHNVHFENPGGYTTAVRAFLESR